jgi:hypothetical protein
MKSFEQQTYYELLDLPPSASDEDIREAHARALEMYAPDSVAVYALEDPSRLEALRARITEALEYLTDAELRREYDASLGLPQRERAEALQAAASGDTSAPPRPELGRGAASRLFARVASPQPGFSISYVAISPFPLFTPTELVRPVASGPAPVLPEETQAEPVRAAEPIASAEPVRAAEPVASAEPVRAAEPIASAASVRAEPAATVALAAVAASPRSADEAAAQEPVAAARAAEPQPEPAPADSALALIPARARELPREEQRPRVPEIPPDAEFNGELLRRVRESRGLTLRVLADRTKIGTRHLENVEADRYDALPTSVYLRGILMSLARELGLDPLRVSKSYLALASATKNR